jgi:CarD family transcriptional regulator, regulator of rRNA transcription
MLWQTSQAKRRAAVLARYFIVCRHRDLEFIPLRWSIGTQGRMYPAHRTISQNRPCTLCTGREAGHIYRAWQLFEVNRVVATPVTTAMVAAALEATAAKAKPKDASPFRKGDVVVYPTHGVGRIDRVGFEEIAGHRLNLIHISFEDHQMTLRIPVAQARAAGLRKLASRTALDEALATLQGRPRTSRLMWAKRSQEYLAKINTSDPGALAEVVRDLQTAADGTGSSFSQRNLFELALDRLAGEVAAVNGIAKLDAIAQLHQALVDARTTERPRPNVGG